MDENKPQVVILMAVYQGASFLQAQLDSIAMQTYRDWRLIVSDDGSSDESRDIISRFVAGCRPGQVSLVEGPRKGATRNFLHLLQLAPEGHYLSFSDQDDLWLPEKLARAVAALRMSDGPAHYAARTVICNAQLHPMTTSRYFHRPFGFRNALIQACMAGNTSVFNDQAAGILKAGVHDAIQAGIISHDWWAYLLLSGAGAQILRDDAPVLLYRQHDKSEMGRNDTMRAMATRLNLLMDGNFGRWLSDNHDALVRLPALTSENREILDKFRDALTFSGPKALQAFRRLGLYRHTRAGTLAFYAAAASGRLRQGRGSRFRR